MPKVATHSVVIMTPMTPYNMESNGVAALKWLIRPRAAWMMIAPISATPTTAIRVPSHQAVRRQRWVRCNNQAKLVL